jgi:hypothetical protein
MEKTKRTRVKTFRLDIRLLELLQKAARKKRVSENSFVAEVLQWRLTVDPLIPAFDGLLIGEDTFSSILGMVEVGGLELAGRDLGRKHYLLAKELYQSNGMTLTLSEFMNEILDKHGKWFHVEGDFAQRLESITLRHRYGLKWSIFLRSYLMSAFESAAHEKPQIRTTESWLNLRIPKPIAG